MWCNKTYGIFLCDKEKFFRNIPEPKQDKNIPKNIWASRPRQHYSYFLWIHFL